MPQTFLSEIYLRARLFKKTAYRSWKSLILAKGARKISGVSYESESSNFSVIPTIILSTFTNPFDFLVLSYLFRDKELTFIAPENLPDDKIIRWVQSINHVLYWRKNQTPYSFFKKLFAILRNYNRSVIVSPAAANQFGKELSMAPTTLVRIAMKTNAPILPVILEWSTKQSVGIKSSRCHVRIGKPIFISPRTEEFHDIFFKIRGVRKFSKISEEDLIEMGKRILNKLKKKGVNGSSL